MKKTLAYISTRNRSKNQM